MKYLKQFEGYIDNKIKSLKKIKEIVDFIEKYEMEYFVLAMEMEDDNYMFEDIQKVGDVYKLEFYDYNVKKHYSNVEGELVDLLKLSEVVVDSLYSCCKDHGRLEVEYHLETGVDIDGFISILKKHRKPIVFSTWMFGVLLENDEQDKVNSFEFQNMLFSTHPESYKSFIDECFGSLKVSEEPGYDFGPFKVNPKILKKYKKLIGDYYHDKEVEYEAGKYNM